MARLALAVAVASLICLSAPLAASAVEIHVTIRADTVADDGQCSLREAITAANLDTAFGGCPKGNGADSVVLGAGAFTLSQNGPGENSNVTGDLDVTGDLTVTGAGAADTSIDASGFAPATTDRVIDVRPGARVTLEDLTVTGGHAPDGAGGGTVAGLPGNPGQTVSGGTGGTGADGGGILNAGTLTLDRVSVVVNDAGRGGVGGFAQAGSGDGCACDGGNGFGGVGGPGGNGGGVANRGTLTLDTSTIAGNTAGTGGGGGEGEGGAGGAFGNNVGHGGDGSGGSPGSGGFGGGIFNAGTLTVHSSSIMGNRAGDGGEGGFGQGAAGATSNGFKGADGLGDGSSGGDGGFGGGISEDVAGGTGTTSIENSTLADNHSGTGGGGASGLGGGTNGNSFAGSGGGGGYGGALLVRGTGDTVSSSTIAGNDTGTGGERALALVTATGTGFNGHDGTAPHGLAVASYSAGVLLQQDTIALNGHGLGVPILPAGTDTLYLVTGSATVANSIVTGSCAVNGASPLHDAGHNLAADAAGCPGSPGDPNLAALADNGGPTRTLALQPGSAAIDQIPAGPDCPPTDQRGVARPQFAACDIGAFELTPPPPGSGHDTVAPTISRVAVKPKTFAVAKASGSAAARRVPRGTTISFQLSEPARVRLAIQRKQAGIKVANKAGKRVCVAATKANRRKLVAQVKAALGAKAKGPGAAARIKRALRKARCSRFATKGALSVTAKVGDNRVPFSGRIKRKALRTGPYRVRLTGSDPAGNRSRPATAAFRIVKP